MEKSTLEGLAKDAVTLTYECNAIAGYLKQLLEEWDGDGKHEYYTGVLNKRLARAQTRLTILQSELNGEDTGS